MSQYPGSGYFRNVPQNGRRKGSPPGTFWKAQRATIAGVTEVKNKKIKITRKHYFEHKLADGCQNGLMTRLAIPSKNVLGVIQVSSSFVWWVGPLLLKVGRLLEKRPTFVSSPYTIVGCLFRAEDGLVPPLDLPSGEIRSDWQKSKAKTTRIRYFPNTLDTKILIRILKKRTKAAAHICCKVPVYECPVACGSCVSLCSIYCGI